MRLLSYIRDLCADFLFPKSGKVLELESLSTAHLLKTLPPSETLNDEDNIAIFDYSHPLVKELVWEIKYNGNKTVAQKIGEILYDVLLQEVVERDLSSKWPRPIVMPVPMAEKRRFERGWNQAELIVEATKRCDLDKTFRYIPKQLTKLKHTESQTRTSGRAERLANLVNSMQVINTDRVSGECVIVVDDVTTTEATFTEARRALRDAGAKKVICVALAH